MNELEKKLAELRAAMKSYIGRDLNEEETNKLADLNKQAAAVKAQIEAAEQLDAEAKELEAKHQKEIKEAVEEAERGYVVFSK